MEPAKHSWLEPPEPQAPIVLFLTLDTLHHQAFENVELPMTLLGKLSEAQRHARVADLLALVGLRCLLISQ